MNLDLVAAAGTGWIALCLFTLYALSNRKHDRWMNMPGYVRRGMAVTGMMFVWRSVNFAMLVPEPGATLLGHVNAEGIMAMLALAYTMTALVVWSGFFHRLPKLGWPRIHFAEQQEKEGLVPVMMTPRQVTDMAKARGMNVNGEVPPAAP